jgi:hypothetical protein
MSTDFVGGIRSVMSSLIVAAVAAVALGATPVGAAGPTYLLTDIGPTAPYTAVYVNYSNHVAGTAQSRHAIWFFDGSMHTIPGPTAALRVEALGISNYDFILVRAALDHGRINRLYVVRHPAAHPVWMKLPLHAGYVSSHAGGIAAWGNVIAGSIRLRGSTRQEPVLWTYNGRGFGRPLILPLPPGTHEGAATTIDRGRGGNYIAGWASFRDGRTFPTIWIHRGGKTWTRKLPTPTGTTAVATSIAVSANDAKGGAIRSVVGNEYRDGRSSAVVWSLQCWARCKGMTQPRVLSASGRAQWVNRAGVVVGTVTSTGGSDSNMIWNPDNTSWTLPLLPYSINDRGRIAGEGSTASGAWHAWLAQGVR